MGAVDPSDDQPTTFADLGLRPELLTALTELGYEEPTPIQREAVPALLDGRDLLGQAATGTGKTAAFGLPILQALGPSEDRAGPPTALVLAPTRELAMQVSEALHRYGRGVGARVLPVFGGQPIGRQVNRLRRGVDVVVATPGRALDHLSRGSLDLAHVRAVVLDEADEMLDMGFIEDIETLLGATPTERQTMLFSATLPRRIEALAGAHLREPLRVRIAEGAPDDGEAPRVRQAAYVVARAHKAAALGRLLDVEEPEAALVFCRTRNEVDALAETLNGRGYRAEALHGGMAQEQRDRVMGRLRSGTAELLVATDVAARGLDVDVLTHVVNYDVPSAPASYVHRIGRVGRAGREGVALTLAEPRERGLVRTIERVTGRPLPLLPLPSVEDVRAARLDSTEATLRTVLEERADELDRLRPVLGRLAGEHEPSDVTLAALLLAEEAAGSVGDEVEIPVPTAPREGGAPPGGKGPGRAGSRRGGPPAPGTTRVYVGLGRDARIRPGDLVGAIAGETRLSGKAIGSIEITARFSLVEVPEDAVDEVIAALRATRIKGRKATVRRDAKAGGG